MEQLAILLLIAAISIINWLIQKSRETREKRKLEKRADATGEDLKRLEPAPPPETQTETAMRRLREALGLPEEAEPPVIPKRVEPPAKPKKPKKQPASPPPPLSEPVAPPPLPRPERKPIVSEVTSRLRMEERHTFGLPHHAMSKTAPKPAREQKPRSRIRELLASPGGLRDAVVLSEILGPPKGTRDGRSLL